MLIALSVVALTSALVVPVARADTWPCNFYGTARVDGNPVDAGTEITAWVGAVQIGSALTGAGALADDTFSIGAEYDDTAGAPEVSFKIGELWANETAMWVQYGAVEVNLTAGGAPSAPSAPSNPSPADGATNIATPVTLSVLASDPNGDTMAVTFYDASNDNVIATDSDVSSGSRASVTWSGLELGTQYSWYTRANDGELDSLKSATWSFTIHTVPGETPVAPSAPSNPSPADGATNIATPVTLSVLVSDPNGDAMAVTFYDASNDSVIATDSHVASGSRASVTWSGLELGTQYSWYAEANDGELDSPKSATWSFATTSEAQAPSSIFTGFTWYMAVIIALAVAVVASLILIVKRRRY